MRNGRLFMPRATSPGNIAIRTIVHRAGRCKLGTGSGIVWDAAAGAEYEETLVKASFATPPAGDTWRPDPGTRLGRSMRAAEGFQLFETILLDPREGDATIEAPLELAGLSPSLAMSDTAVLARYWFLDEHLDRMAGSARALGLRFDRRAGAGALGGLRAAEPRRTRSTWTWRGDGSQHLDAPRAGRRAHACGAHGLPLSDRSGRPPPAHKTSVRGFYNREHRRAVPKAASTLSS